MSTHADVTTYLPFSGTGNAGVISIEGNLTGCCVPLIALHRVDE